MNEAAEHRHELLIRCIDAGPAGHAIEQGELADAITLGVLDLVILTKTQPQRAVATLKGKAHVRRAA